MDQAPRMAFSHIGLYVSNIASMVSFYTDVLGFSITDQAHIRGASVVFLSRNPDEHHQIVLVPGRSPQSPSTINQISFRVVSFPELRRLHAQLVALGVGGLNPTNHGGSWSVYFLDPRGQSDRTLCADPVVHASGLGAARLRFIRRRDIRGHSGIGPSDARFHATNRMAQPTAATSQPRGNDGVSSQSLVCADRHLAAGQAHRVLPCDHTRTPCAQNGGR